MSQQTRHVIQIIGDFQTVANCERELSKTAYAINPTHQWEKPVQIDASHFMIKVTFANLNEANAMVSEIEKISKNLSSEIITLRSNPSRLAA
jgi:hypothetical protein